jgi:ABC-type lipoprotein release transport system permease subunit
MEKFETRIGHKMVLMSQDTSGDIASRAFQIVGVFDAEMQATEKQFVFITQTAAQQMLDLGNSITEITLKVPTDIPVADLAQNLRSKLDQTTLEINTWQELLPLLMTYLKLYDSFIAIWYLVVFVAMGFGIVNTTLMAVFERMREFGLLKALGMQPGGILRSVLVESFLLLMLGLILGNSLGIASTLLFARNGIDLTALAAGAEFAGLTRLIVPALHLPDILLANTVVLLLGLLVCLYPASKAAKFTPVEALRQN